MLKRLTALILLCLLLLTGCANKPSKPTPTDIPSTEPEPEVKEFYQAVQDILSQEEDTTQYSMQLTEEQAAAYSSGMFILFRHFGGDEYLPFYYSNNVTLDGTVLRANFNGKVPYVTDSHSRCWVPTTDEWETKDGKTYYSISYRTGNYEATDSGEEYVVTDHVMHMVYDRATGKLIHAESLPEGQQPEQDIFLGNNTQIQLDTPFSFIFPQGPYYLSVKDENNALLPMTQWENTNATSGLDWPGEAGIHFSYGRLSEITAPSSLRDVYMVFLTKDKDGNRCGSELIPVPVIKDQKIEAAPVSVESVQWDSDNRVLLTEEQGVAVYLTKTSDWGIISYDIEMRNDNDFPVKLQISDLMFNQRFWAGGPYFTAGPQSWGGDTVPIQFPLASALGDLDVVNNLSMKLSLSHNTTQKTLWEKNLEVNTSGNAALKAYYRAEDSIKITEPFKGFLLSEEQLLLEKDGVKISLIKAGAVPDYEKFSYLYRVENTTNELRNFVHNGIDINGTFHHISNSKTLLPGEIYYAVSSENELYGIEAISRVRFNFGIEKGKFTYTESQWYEAIPQQAAQNPSTMPEGDKVLLEEQGLRISLKEQTLNSGGSKIWTLAVVNTTDQDMNLIMTDISIDGVPFEGSYTTDVTASNGRIGAKQGIWMDIKSKEGKPVSFRLKVNNMDQNQFFFITETLLELS